MVIKRVLCPERVRSIPAQFSWVDHRLVRDRHIERYDASALALYLFLVTVADAQGLSYYSDAALGKHVSMDAARLHQARNNLIRGGLIAYQRPLPRPQARHHRQPRQPFLPRPLLGPGLGESDHRPGTTDHL